MKLGYINSPSGDDGVGLHQNVNIINGNYDLSFRVKKENLDHCNFMEVVVIRSDIYGQNREQYNFTSEEWVTNWPAKRMYITEINLFQEKTIEKIPLIGGAQYEIRFNPAYQASSTFFLDDVVLSLSD